MNDIVILGIVCVGLAVYCLRLRHENQQLHKAGQFVTGLLIKQMDGETVPELDNARAILKRMRKTHD